MKIVNKVRFVFGILAVAVLAQGCFSARLSEEEIAAKSKRLEVVVNAGTWRIDVDRCTGFGGRNIDLTGYYFLQLNGENVKMRLPFYGKADDPLLMAHASADMEGVITEKEIKATPKGDGWEINFKTKADFESYEVKVTIYYDGGAVIYLFPSSRTDMSYYGNCTF